MPWWAGAVKSVRVITKHQSAWWAKVVQTF
jgi:hypothetical protein